MRSITRSEVAGAHRFYATRLTGCVTAIVVITLWPKGGAGPGAGRFRFACALGYFAAWAGLLWLLTTPRSRYMHTLYAWRYEGQSDAFERQWRRYLYLLDRVIAWPAWAAIALVGALALKTVLTWYLPAYPGWGRLAGPVATIGWGAVAALVAFPLLGASRIQEVFRRRRMLDEELALSDDPPGRSLDRNCDPAERTARRAVVRAGPGTFHAGGLTWTFEDLSKNVAVFGQVGSGKTVCVLNALLEGLIAANSSSGANEPIGGLILDPKGDFRTRLEVLCDRYGRRDDLFVIDPSREDSPRWNPLDTDDSPVEVAARILAVMETLGVRSGDSSFFLDYCRKFFRHALTLTRATNPAGVPPSFADLGRLATDADALRARVARAPAEGGLDLHETFAFFSEWSQLNHETRSGVIGSITNLVDSFLGAPYETLFGTHSTLKTGQWIDRGKLVYLALPTSGAERMARLIGTFLKIDYLREVTAPRRRLKPRPTFFFCDEFQKFFTVGGVDGGASRGDADYMDVSREYTHANVIAMQNLNSLLKLTTRPEAVWNLLGLCATKIFLRNSDPDTNEFASRLFGEALHGGVSYSHSPSGRRGGSAWWDGPGTGSVQDQRSALVAPEAFARLAIPRARTPARFCESYVYQGAADVLRGTARKRRWRVHPIVPRIPAAASPAATRP
jgi:hypothetical protein